MVPYNQHPRVSLYECRCANCGCTSLEILQHRLWGKKKRRVKVVPKTARRRREGKMGKFLRALGSNNRAAPAYKQRRAMDERMRKLAASYKSTVYNKGQQV